MNTTRGVRFNVDWDRTVADRRLAACVHMTFGDNTSGCVIRMSLDELRDLVNAGADVLDVWFDEMERGVAL